MNILLIFLIFIIQANAMSWKIFERNETKLKELSEQRKEFHKRFLIPFILFSIIIAVPLTIYEIIIWCLETPEQKEEREKMEKREELEEEKIKLEKLLEKERKKEEKKQKLKLRYEEIESILKTN